MPKLKKYTTRVRVWIDEGKKPFLGIGRVILLQKIKETGSITNAAKSIKMSYRQAWQLVNDMNECSVQPLVIKRLGGKTGGGATVTEAGDRAIIAFHALEKDIQLFVEKRSKNFKF